MNCRICSGTRFSHVLDTGDQRYGLSKKTFGVWKCLRCGVFMTMENGRLVDPYSYYPDEYGAFRNTESSTSPYGKSSRIKNTFMRLFAHMAFDRLSWAARIPMGREVKVLDVGCGSGKIGSHIINAYGARVVGIERNETAAQAARGKGLVVITSLLKDFDFVESFDLILMIHVLEHLTNPLEELRVLHDNLTPGSMIVVAVPNVGSIERKLFGRFWDGWDIPRHVFHFTPSSIRYLMNTAGFKIETILFEVYSISPRSIGNWLLRSRPYHKRSVMRRFRYLEVMFGMLLSMGRASSAMQIIAVRR